MRLEDKYDKKECEIQEGKLYGKPYGKLYGISDKNTPKEPEGGAVEEVRESNGSKRAIETKNTSNYISWENNAIIKYWKDKAYIAGIELINNDSNKFYELNIVKDPLVNL